MFWGIEAKYYVQVFYYVVWFFCLCLCILYCQSPNNHKLLQRNSSLPALVLAIIITIFLGLRPDQWKLFGDSYYYAHTYHNIATASNALNIDFHREWFMGFITSFSKYMHWDIHIYFLIIETFYVMLMFVACRVLLWENTWMAFLFCLSSFSFYGFAVNGLRNGMACSLVLAGIALLSRKNIIYTCVSILLFLIAMGTHRSTLLPVTMSIVALLVVKNPRHAIYVWLFCIIVSLIAGSRVQSFFVGFLGAEDHRIANYSTMQEASQFSHTGFRWDFLLYSSVPVILTYYVSVKRGIQDATFNFLANTYILSNAIWILVIRMAFTNRFAYLSWFIYPLVLAYALIRVHIWDDQDKKAAWFLGGNTLFTAFLYLIGKA